MSSSDEGLPIDDPFTDFNDLLSLTRKQVGEGKSVIELQVKRKHLRSLEIMHGGVAASLLDSAMGVAAGSVSPTNHYTVTAQLGVNFIRPAWEGETLIATGEVLHRGKRTAVARGEIRNSRNVLIAAGSATFLFIPHDPQKGRIERRED